MAATKNTRKKYINTFASFFFVQWWLLCTGEPQLDTIVHVDNVSFVKCESLEKRPAPLDSAYSNEVYHIFSDNYLLLGHYAIKTNKYFIEFVRCFIFDDNRSINTPNPISVRKIEKENVLFKSYFSLF